LILLATTTLSIAKTQIGVQEIPKNSNAGPDVEKYLKSVGLTKGYPWCMAFVFWCVKQSAIKTAIKNPLKKTGGVIDQYNSCPTLRQSLPMPGDIFIMDYGKGIGHTGFVTEVLANGNIKTIEGNTNDDGSREGYEVCERIRKTKSIKSFLRL
jgi:hypothetical protein